MNVYQKLNAARLALQSTKLSKSGHNKFAGYKYFELGDFLPTIQTIFADVGLCGVVSFGTETASLTIVDLDKPESTIVVNSPMSTAALKGCHEVQNLGAVETYIRRYLWVTALEIVEHDALDSSKPIDSTPSVMQVPLKESSKSIAQDHFDKMDAEEQAFLREQADLIKDWFGSSEQSGFDSYRKATEKMDSEEKIALWSLLPSNIRTSIKKQGEKKAA